MRSTPQHPLWKPKFLQSAFAQVMSSVALFTGHIGGGEFVAVTTLVLATFSAASVIENQSLMK